jgi:hypothetical protein
MPLNKVADEVIGGVGKPDWASTRGEGSQLPKIWL